MKITGTMSYIKVEIEGKTVKIEGEKLKQEIIQKVSDKTKNSHLVITFE